MTDKIIQRLAENFGLDRVEAPERSPGERFAIGPEWRLPTAFPANLDELSEMIQMASLENWSVISAGAGTWLEMGNAPAKADLIVSTSRMNRVLEYEPADLTATVEGGATLEAFNLAAMANNQFIPLDSFGDPASTLGAIVATSSAGPMRCAYGTPRDWVIGMRVVQADGRITKAGGKVVKNVAGYDLCKLYTGSFGTLGIIGELCFKLRALPSAERSLAIFGRTHQELSDIVARFLDSDVSPTAVEIVSNGNTVPGGASGPALVVRFLNDQEAIDVQSADAIRLAGGDAEVVLDAVDSTQFWTEYRRVEDSADWHHSLRVSTLPSQISEAIADVERLLPGSVWRAHAANGIVRVFSSGLLETAAVRELRRLSETRGGSVTILRTPEELKGTIDVWGEVGTTAHLMRELKEKFDGKGLLNAGRFASGI
jgi:glycolate oxidase FAD binding subunit